MVNFLRDIGWDDTKIVDELVKGIEGYPKGLQPEQYDCRDQTQKIQYIHEEQKAIDDLNMQTLLDDLLMRKKPLSHKTGKNNTLKTSNSKRKLFQIF